jgi:hypothetical protein
MTDRTEHIDPLATVERIATQQAARAKVDANGKTIGKPSTYTYDNRGRLVSATKGENE